MSKGFTGLVIWCLVSLFVLFAARFFNQGWNSLMWIPLVSLLISFVALLYFEGRTIKKGLLHSSTKAGMGIGTGIIIAFSLVVLVNFVAFKFDVNFDFSESSEFSLHRSTLRLVELQKNELEFMVFYKDKKNLKKMPIHKILRALKKKNQKINYSFYNIYDNPQKAAVFLKGQAVKRDQEVFVFLKNKGKKIFLEPPYEEPSVFKALVQMNPLKKKKIVFTTGHGEYPLGSRDEAENGLSLLKKSLESYNYEVNSLKLSKYKKIPKEIDLVFVAGPSKKFLRSENKLVKEYVMNGGKAIVLANPGESHNLALLFKSFGVEFKNNFVIEAKSSQQSGQVISRFSAKHKLRNMRNKSVIFSLASSLRKSPYSSAFRVKRLVSSGPSSVVVHEFKNQKVNQKMKTRALGYTARAKVGNGHVALIGDADFIKNGFYYAYSNQDFAKGLIGYLINDKRLKGIPVKVKKINLLSLNSFKRNLFMMSAVMVPFAFLIITLVLWFKRKYRSRD